MIGNLPDLSTLVPVWGWLSTLWNGFAALWNPL